MQVYRTVAGAQNKAKVVIKPKIKLKSKHQTLITKDTTHDSSGPNLVPDMSGNM